MCMLSAYIGPRPAAEVLLEMTRIQEVWLGGFATGLATFSEGKIFCEKVIGSVRQFEKTYTTEQLPGKIGIAHSRSEGSDQVRRAHPFIDQNGTLASMSNGILGIFEKSYEQAFREIGTELREKGVSFRSAAEGVEDPCAALKHDCAHGDEVVTHLLGEEIRRTGDIKEAIRQTALELPEESVRIILTAADPEHLYVYNVNQRLIVGQTEQELFLATIPQAFPARPSLRIMELPPDCLAVCGPDGVTVEPLSPEGEFKVDLEIADRIEELFFQYLKSSPGATWADVVNYGFSPHLPDDRATWFLPAGYSVLERCLQKDLVRTEIKEVSAPGTTATTPLISLFLTP